jgi:hypothetical protein
VFSHLKPFVIGEEILDHATLTSKISNQVEIGFFPHDTNSGIINLILALNPFRNVVTSNNTLSFSKLEDGLEVVPDSDSI